MLENQTLQSTHEDPFNELFRKIYCKVLHWQGKQTNVSSSWTESATSDPPAFAPLIDLRQRKLGFPSALCILLVVVQRRCSCTLGLCWRSCKESGKLATSLHTVGQWARLLCSKTHLSGSIFVDLKSIWFSPVHLLCWVKWPKWAEKVTCLYFSSIVGFSDLWMCVGPFESSLLWISAFPPWKVQLGFKEMDFSDLHLLGFFACVLLLWP